MIQQINKENIYLTEEFDIHTNPPSGIVASTSLGIGFVEESSLSECLLQKISISKEENVNLDEKIKMILKLYQTENPFVLIDTSTQNTKENYFNWLFSNPLDENFSFKNDDNIDGVANDCSVENGSAEIIKEETRPHVQKVILNEGGAITVDINIPTNLQRRDYFWLYFNLKMISGTTDFDIHIYYDTIKLSQAWHQKFIAGENNYDWIEHFLKWNIYNIPLFNKIKLVFTGTSSFCLDNILVTKDRSFFRNPETFYYSDNKNNIEIENLISEKKIYLMYSGIEKKGVKLYWGVINRLGLKFLKKLVNKMILFRTHDRRIITGKITSMKVNYLPRAQAPILKLELGIEEI